MTQKSSITPISKAEASGLTDRIRKAVDGLWSLLLEAHERKAWKALGYRTWEAYVKAEFDMSRQNSYRLLDQARVVREIEAIVPHAGQITQRDAETIKADLPAVTDQIRSRVEQGEDPETAIAEVIDAKRTEKEKAKAKQEADQDEYDPWTPRTISSEDENAHPEAEREAQQAEHDRQRDEARAALPEAIKQREQAKADAVAGRKAKPIDVEALTAEIDELREANASLEAELATVKADNAKWQEMRVQFEQGGFDKVVAGKDEEIRVLKTRLYGESADKASWMKSAKYWQAEAQKLGWTNGDFTVDLETGEIADA